MTTYLTLELLKPAIIIGIVAVVMTYIGIVLGKKISEKFGKHVETVGTLVLYIIAFKLLSI